MQHPRNGTPDDGNAADHASIIRDRHRKQSALRRPVVPMVLRDIRGSVADSAWNDRQIQAPAILRSDPPISPMRHDAPSRDHTRSPT